MSETRKLQQLGGSTLYVSLPKRWVTQTQLKRGEKVALIPQLDGSIQIFPAEKKEKPREVVIDINAENSIQLIRREIKAAYVDGFEIIKLNTHNRFTEEQPQLIRDIIDSLFGLEIIERTGKTITIQCLLTRNLPIERTLQRIHNILLAMFSDTILALDEQNHSIIKGLTSRVHDISRLSLVINRLLRSLILFPTPTEHKEIRLIDCVDFLQILHIVDEVAGNVTRMSEIVAMLSENALPPFIQKPLSQACTPIQELYNHAVQALLSNNVTLANRVLDYTLPLETFWKRCKEADEQSTISCLTLAHVYLLVEHLKQIQQYSKEIAEITIDRVEAETK